MPNTGRTEAASANLCQARGSRTSGCARFTRLKTWRLFTQMSPCRCEDRSSLLAHRAAKLSAAPVFSHTDPLVLMFSFYSVVAFAVCRSSLTGSVGIAVPCDFLPITLCRFLFRTQLGKRNKGQSSGCPHAPWIEVMVSKMMHRFFPLVQHHSVVFGIKPMETR